MIKGIIIKKIKKNEDDRGWLSEIFRNDEDKLQAVMSYVSYTKFNVTRGPHEHKSQTDFLVFVGPGNFKLCLWDNRKSSKTVGEFMKLTVGESNNVSVLVPPEIVHEYKSISKKGSFSINLPDKLYKGKGKKEEVDEIRHEEKSTSPFKIR